MPNEKSSFPSDAADKFVVRFPEGMRDRIAEAAKSNNRTMNAELVARIEQSLAGQDEAAAHKAATDVLNRLNLALSLTLDQLADYVPEELLKPNTLPWSIVKMAKALTSGQRMVMSGPWLMAYEEVDGELGEQVTSMHIDSWKNLAALERWTLAQPQDTPPADSGTKT